MGALPLETRLVYRFSVDRNQFRKIGEEISQFKRALSHIGFPSDASRRALIVAYELGMNIVIHAYKGELTAFWQDGHLEITSLDEGPGIQDIDLAMKEGYSTAPDYVREMGYGAGMGLPNAKKSSDEMQIQSSLGEGTKVYCRILPGVPDRNTSFYFHSVKLDALKCKGCTNCIKGCPTEAIRVRNGKAFILEDRCIDCGECIRRCPNHAKLAQTDLWDDLQKFDCKIALLPPSFYGQLGDISPSHAKAALLGPGGFDYIFDVSMAADLCSRAMKRYVQEVQEPRPLISPACPAVVRLIQVKYPSLLKHLIPCEAPMEVAAWLGKSGVFREVSSKIPTAIFISPCPAKVTAARQPVGRGRSMVDAIVSLSEVVLWVKRHAAEVRGAQDGSGGGFQDSLKFPTSTGLGIGWGRSGGEMAAVGMTGLAVDGISNVASVLDEIEKGALGNVDFIEAQACVGGCVGGCLTAENPFIARMRLRTLARECKDADESPITKTVKEERPEIWLSMNLLPRPIFRLDTDPEKARDKRQKLLELEKELPGLDCGACGAPTCRALAEDIVLGRGSLWDCTFKLRERLENLAQEVKDLAGKKPPAMGI